VLACLHRDSIAEVIASDVNETALEVANRNLSLLTPAGLDRRIDEISNLLAAYGKDSHKAALASAQALRQVILDSSGDRALPFRTFRASALDPAALAGHVPRASIDIVFTDVPYGLHSRWIDPERLSANPLNTMVEGLRDLLSPTGVAVVVFDKSQKASPAGYRRLEQFQSGKRRVAIFRRA
jgi:hypothetical protein